MGVAIVLKGCDFSGKNLGKVTFVENADVTGINISGPVTVVGLGASYTASYLPVNTSQRGCTWSVTSGADYAEIDQTTGRLTIKAMASTACKVTIRATSTFNAGVVATKEVSVMYSLTVDELAGISITGPDTAGLSGAKYAIAYVPVNTSRTGVTWSVTSGSSFARIDQEGNLTVTGAGIVTIKAVSTYDGSIMAEKTVTTSTAAPAIYMAFNLAGHKAGLLTDIVVPNLSVAELEVSFMRRSGNAIIGFGSRGSSSADNRFAIAANDKGAYNVMFGRSQTGDIGSLGTAAHTFVMDKDGYTLDGERMDYVTTGALASANTAPIAIGNLYNADTSSWQSFAGGARIAYLKIREGGVLTHDLEPYTNGIDFGFQDMVTGSKYSCVEPTGMYNYVENFYA